QILQVIETETPLQRPQEPADTRLPSPGEERVHEVDGSVLVYVPGGEYVLGADDIDADSKPVHRVVLSPFWIGKYEVTHKQYGRFLSAVPGTARPENWDDNRFNQLSSPA